MRTPGVLSVVSLVLAWGMAQSQETQPVPAVGPPFAEVEALWNAFWTHVVDGDMMGAEQYIHSFRRYPLSTDKARSELQDLARQMAFCRLDPTPFALGRDEVAYRVPCKHGSETAESLVVLRRDFDGVWRLFTF